MLTSRFLLPGSDESDSVTELERLFTTEFKVVENAPIVGKSLAEMGYMNPLPGFRLLALKRNGMVEVKIEPKTRLKAGDVLVFSAVRDVIADLWGTVGLEPVHGAEIGKISSPRHSHRLIEAIVSRRSMTIGRKINELPLPESPVPVSIIAVSQGGRPTEGIMSEVQIESGDVAVLEVDELFFHENQVNTELSMVRRLTDARIKRYDRAYMRH